MTEITTTFIVRSEAVVTPDGQYLSVDYRITQECLHFSKVPFKDMVSDAIEINENKIEKAIIKLEEEHER